MYINFLLWFTINYLRSNKYFLIMPLRNCGFYVAVNAGSDQAYCYLTLITHYNLCNFTILIKFIPHVNIIRSN